MDSHDEAKRLQVIKVLLGAFMVPWNNRRLLSKKLAVIFALLLLLNVSMGYADEWISSRWRWCLWALECFFFAIFAVICHRVILLGKESLQFSFIPRIDWRELRFFAFVVALLLIYLSFYLVPVMALMNFGPWFYFGNGPTQEERELSEIIIEWGFYFIQIPALYVCSRLSLVFPATAIDHRPSLKWSWGVSKGNGWRIFVTVGALPWVFSALIWSLYRDGATDYEYVVLTAIYVLVTVFEVAALSLSYKDLVEGDLSRDKIVIEI